MKRVVFLMKIKEHNSNEYSPAIFNWYGILEELGYEVYYEDYSSYNADEFYKLVKESKPDYIFHPTYEPLHTEVVRWREFSKVYCIHSDDDWRLDNFVKYWIPFTDGAIGYQNHSSAYTNLGASENYYNRARWAFNPKTMLHSFSSEKIYRLTHLGGLHGNKQHKINLLKSKGLDITLIDPKFGSYRSYLEGFAKSIASLCFTNNSLGTALQSKTRLGEMPYYCVLVSEPWPDYELWNMEPNKDFVLLDGTSTSLEVLDRVLNDEPFSSQMYESAKNILINKNTVFHEWNRIMQNIDPDFKIKDVNKILKQFNL